MKRRCALLVVCASLTAAVIAGSCGLTRNVTAPAIGEIRTALGTNNPYGMAVGLTLGQITLPECSSPSGYELVYELDGLPSWLDFDPNTRRVSLYQESTVPEDAFDAYEVTYYCYDELDPAFEDKITFTINDLDGGGVVDAWEYLFGAVPLLNDGFGWIWLNPGDVDIYRTPAASPRKVPTGIVVPTAGMDPTDATDDNADFDGDGKSNAQEITDGTNIFVATSTGQFSAQVTYATGTFPGSIATADFNGNGNLDLAVTNDGDNTISILLGAGNGTFTAGATLGAGNSLRGIVSADFDGDGNKDLAATNAGDDNISVLLGAGDGTFATQATPATGDFPNDIAAADLDGDGDLDLVTPNNGDNNISVLAGAGDGTFATQQTYPTGTNPRNIIAADLDGDGDLDLAVTNGGGSNISVLLGAGNGTFPGQTTYPVGSGPFDIAAADLDGNGNLDLVVTDSTDNTISVLLGEGDGTFADRDTITPGGSLRFVAAADLNGDGDLDLAVTNGPDDTVSVLLGNGDGTFANRVTYAAAAGDNPYGIVAADLNGDGDLDLVTADLGGGRASVFLNQ